MLVGFDDIQLQSGGQKGGSGPYAGEDPDAPREVPNGQVFAEGGWVDLRIGDDVFTDENSEILAAETFSDFKDRAERAYILQRLRENDWNVAETARQIDMPRSNLYKKIEKYGLVREG